MGSGNPDRKWDQAIHTLNTVSWDLWALIPNAPEICDQCMDRLIPFAIRIETFETLI
jgi:hypothetical protein